MLVKSRRKVLIAPGFKFQAEQYLENLDIHHTIDSEITVLSGTPKHLWRDSCFSNIQQFMYVPLYSKIISRITRLPRLKMVDYGLYARRIRNIMSDYSLVHLWSGFGDRDSLVRFKGKLIIERACPHILSQREVIVKEYKKYNLSIKFSDRLTHKMLLEYDRADIIIVPSFQTAQSFYEHGFDQERIKVVSLTGNNMSKELIGSEPNAESILKKEADFFVIGFIGGDIIRKGLIYLIEALILIKQDGRISIPLKLILKTSNLKKFPFLTDLLKRNSIEFEVIDSYLSNPSIFYHSIDCLVLPSIEEGYGMVVPEALSFGLPVLVSDRVGAILNHSHLPLSKFGVVKAFDAQSISASIESLVEKRCFLHRFDDLDCKVDLDNFRPTSYSELMSRVLNLNA